MIYLMVCWPQRRKNYDIWLEILSRQILLTPVEQDRTVTRKDSRFPSGEPCGYFLGRMALIPPDAQRWRRGIGNVPCFGWRQWRPGEQSLRGRATTRCRFTLRRIRLGKRAHWIKKEPGNVCLVARTKRSMRKEMVPQRATVGGEAECESALQRNQPWTGERQGQQKLQVRSSKAGCGGRGLRDRRTTGQNRKCSRGERKPSP